jgi:hypothetical protein
MLLGSERGLRYPSEDEYQGGAMALSGKYGKLNIPKIGEDEPVFILRVRDTLALPAIEIYKVLATFYGSVMAPSLEKEVKTFQEWKGPKKLPD